MTYVGLHCHSCFSFREGASTPLELVLEARKLGYPALALTDHDGLAGAMEFAQVAKEWDVSPIIGAEVTLQPSPRPSAAPLPEGEGTGVRAHLTLLADVVSYVIEFERRRLGLREVASQVCHLFLERQIELPRP